MALSGSSNSGKGPASDIVEIDQAEFTQRILRGEIKRVEVPKAGLTNRLDEFTTRWEKLAFMLQQIFATIDYINGLVANAEKFSHIPLEQQQRLTNLRDWCVEKFNAERDFETYKDKLAATIASLYSQEGVFYNRTALQVACGEAKLALAALQSQPADPKYLLMIFQSHDWLFLNKAKPQPEDDMDDDAIYSSASHAAAASSPRDGSSSSSGMDDVSVAVETRVTVTRGAPPKPPTPPPFSLFQAQSNQTIACASASSKTTATTSSSSSSGLSIASELKAGVELSPVPASDDEATGQSASKQLTLMQRIAKERAKRRESEGDVPISDEEYAKQVIKRVQKRQQDSQDKLNQSKHAVAAAAAAAANGMRKKRGQDVDIDARVTELSGKKRPEIMVPKTAEELAREEEAARLASWQAQIRTRASGDTDSDESDDDFDDQSKDDDWDMLQDSTPASVTPMFHASATATSSVSFVQTDASKPDAMDDDVENDALALSLESVTSAVGSMKL